MITIKFCCYCDHSINEGTYDWGLTLVDYSYRYWHRECFEVIEMAVIEGEL